MLNNNIPVIDISHILNTDLSKFNKSQSDDSITNTINKIDCACKNIGVFYISNYDIAENNITKALDTIKKFFELPAEIKHNYIISKSSENVGYSPIGEENLGDYNSTDIKEAFNVSPDLAPGQDLLVSDIPEFKTVLYNYYNKLYKISIKLLQAIAIALHQPHDIFTKDFIKQSGIMLRFLNYPPARSVDIESNKDKIICGAHSDYGYLTILRQDNIGGLQILNKQHKWINATPIDNTFVVNIGDLMQRWTNDVYKSTKHRVINNNSGKNRQSIAFFVEPNYNTVISSLDNCITKENPAKYNKVISGDWIKQRLNETYAYRQT